MKEIQINEVGQYLKDGFVLVVVEELVDEKKDEEYYQWASKYQ